MLILLIAMLITTANARDFTAPEVFDSGKNLMPEADTFGEGLWMILQDLFPLIRPDLFEASRVSLALIASVMLTSMLRCFSDSVKVVGEMAGTAAISAALLLSAQSLISLGADTVREMSEYGKLLIPVLTTAMAAQGSVGTSAALNAGATAFSAVLSSLISGLLIPLVYLYLTLATASAATGEEMLKKLRDMMKSAMSWLLKSLLTLFTTYMGITGVISGVTDSAALKAARTTISTVVPVVGGILSEASEAVLLSVSLAKNAAGLYGIFAVLAIFLEPFARIGCHFLILKGTHAVCSVFGMKNLSDLIGDYCGAMGLLLGMTGSVCLLLLIAVVCFLKGVGG